LYGDVPVNVESHQLREIERRTVDLLEDEGRAAASMPDALESMLKRCGLEGGRIGVDDWSVASMLGERLPSCRCIPGKKLLEQIRVVKTPREAARLRAAVSLVAQLERLPTEQATPGHAWSDCVVDAPTADSSRDAAAA